MKCQRPAEESDKTLVLLFKKKKKKEEIISPALIDNPNRMIRLVGS